MLRGFSLLLLAGLGLAACATGSRGGPAADDDDDATGAGGSGTGGVATTTGTGAGATTTGAGGTTTTTGSGGATSSTGSGGATSSTGSGGATSSSVSSSSSTGSGGGCTTTQLLADTGFEGGTPNPSWTEASTNFGTPLCTVTDCGTGGSSNPVHGGSWFAWFGGYQGGVEQAGLQQTITIPANAQSATLTYWLEAPVCDAVIDFGVFIDSNLLQYWTEPGTTDAYPGCGLTPNWTLQTIDVMPYADGQPKVLSIEAYQDATFSLGVSNFMVDDVTLTVCN